MNKALLVVVATILSFNVLAEEPKADSVIETETFKMRLPPGWKETKRGPKTLLLRAGNQTADISIARITGEGTTEEMAAARLKLKENLRKAIAVGAQSSTHLVAQPVQEKQVANGNTVISSKLRTLDKSLFVHQYGVLGPGAGLLVTVEGPVAELFNASMFEFYLTTSVQWK